MNNKKQKRIYKEMMLLGLALSAISLFGLMASTKSAIVILLSIAGVIVTATYAVLCAEIIDAEYAEENYNDAKYEFEENSKKAEFITLDAEKWSQNE